MEFPEIFDGMEDFFGGLDEIKTEEEAGNYVKNFLDENENFKKLPGFENFESITKAEEGFDITTKDGGEWNTEEVKADFNGDLEGDVVKDPNITDGFKKLGFGDDSLNSKEFKEFEEQQQKEFEKSPATEEVKSVNEAKSSGEEMTKKYGEVKSEEEFKKVLDKNDQLKEELQKWKDKTTEEAEKSEGKLAKAGKWIKSNLKYLILAGITGGSLYKLYNIIKDHQNDMNGCWMINTKTGDKCKVDLLTCNNDLLSGNGFVKCSYCTSLKTGCSNPPNFNPCLVKDETADNLNKQDYPGCTGQSGKAVCTNCTSTNIVSCAGESSDCSQLCNSGLYKMPKDTILKCVSVDFFGAYKDLQNEAADTGTNFLKNILKILFYVALVIIGLGLLVLLSKFIFGKKESHSSNSQTGQQVMFVPVSQTPASH